MTISFKKLAIFFIVGFIAATIIFVLAGWLYFYFGFLQKVDLGVNDINIEIKQGENLSDVTKKLKELGIIKNELLFKLAIRKENLEKKLQTGIYTFKGALNSYDVIKILKNQPDIVVTFPEGKTVEEFAKILQENKIITKEDFLNGLKNFDAEPILGFSLNSFEGYLFPDTYRFRQGQKPDVIIKTLLENFKQKVLVNLSDMIQNSKFTIQNLIIMSSIIEKEVIGENDKKIAAGILWKRFQDNYPLQVDATLNYILSDKKSFLSAKELQLDSPYNSYKYKGLPPTAISNPGLESILAALKPLETDYYFYLTDRQGKAHFAKTYDEHLQNIKKYIR